MICFFGGLLFIFVGVLFSIYPSSKNIASLTLYNDRYYNYFKIEKFYGRLLIFVGFLLLSFGLLIYFFITSKIHIFLDGIIFISGVILAIYYWEKHIKLLINNISLTKK